jgi:hypothetical protein
MFDLITTTGVLFTYTVNIPDRTQMQMVSFAIESPFTADASMISMNVATLAVVGKSVEQTLVEHVEHYERVAARNEGRES